VSALVRRPALPIAAAAALVLVVFAHGYGPHRDEMYFVAAGHHPAVAYPDQGPVTPLIARAMDAIGGGSLTVLRLPSALMLAGIVLLTGALARELGGGRRAEAIAAACTALGVVFLFTGHLLSTTTPDLLVWTAVIYLAVRAVRRGDDRLWPLAGLVLGVGLLNKPLPAFLAVGLLAGVAIAGPRALLRNRAVWAGAAIAFVIWLPWIVWQARHGWPQVDVSRNIAAGGSGSSEPRWALLPFQLLLVSPLLAPVWIAGLVRLFRDAGLRDVRFLGWTWVVLVVVFLAAGGKPYYLAGLLPVLLAAGAQPTVEWLAARRARRMVFAVAFGLSAVIDPIIALPLLPAKDAGPVVAMNGDVGETVGWPQLVDTVARVRDGRDAVIFTANYGQAGAVDRYGPDRGLPRAYSGHNGYGYWGHPPDGPGPAVVVGYDRPPPEFRGCRLGARFESPGDLDNDENGTAIWACDGLRGSWADAWPKLRRLG
jgi:4-amino-4-deoxy-L-arabinose transferase-like glycosyltransferase